MQAIPLLEEVVRIAPNLPDAYYILGLIYDAMGNRKKALNFHMIAAHLSPKDPALWRKLIAWSMYALLNPDNLILCNLNLLYNNPSTCLARISCHFFLIIIILILSWCMILTYLCLLLSRKIWMPLTLLVFTFIFWFVLD